MPLEIDDPRLTEFALGEMDAAEREAFERELAESPEARQEVEAIRRAAGLVTAALAGESAPSLDAARRAAIFAPAQEVSVSPRWRGMTTGRWISAVVAAGLSGVILTAVTMKGLEDSHTYEVAQGSSRAKTLADGDAYQFEAQRSQEELAKIGRVATNFKTEPASGPQAEARTKNTHYDVGAAPAPNGSLNIRSADGRAVATNESLVTQLSTANGESAPAKKPLSASLAEGADVSGGGKRGQALNESNPTTWGDLYKRRSPPRIGGGEARTLTFNPDGEVDELSDQLATSVNVGDDWEYARRQDVNRLSGFADGEFSTEGYAPIVENAFKQVIQEPLSTFSIDVDTASYANVRRFLTQNTLPPPGAVRLEEMINYFKYDYAPPTDDKPFAVHVDVAQCPWEAKHRLVRVGIKGRELSEGKRPATNLVFLIDVSGSMQDANKLELVKTGLRLLTEQLSENDRVAMVVYAGSSGQVLASTPGNQKEAILAALDQLQAGGSTNGAGGIEQAYQVAVENFITGGANRVILCTDGDFNVGVTDQSQLVNLIEGKAKSGVFLSVLGFGMGNLKDDTLEKLADKGNGNYGYIDSEREARKVLVEQLNGTLVTIAKDVKIQIEFNPAKAAGYRLIGYENRMLANEDFNDDTKDAGEIGAGHTVTALYEVVPVGEQVAVASVDELEYQVTPGPTEKAKESNDLLMCKLRYKLPDGDTSQLIKQAVADSEGRIGQTKTDFQFAASVAAFGMLLRHSQYAGNMNYGMVLELAEPGLTQDEEGYRAEFLELVKKAQQLSGQHATPPQP